MNRHLAFGDRHAGTTLWREYLGYLATMLGGAVVNLPGAYVLVLHSASGPLGADARRGRGQRRRHGRELLRRALLVFKARRSP